MKSLYELAKETRDTKKISLRELAERVGCSHQLIQFWENGKRNLDHSIQSKICRELGINASEHFSLSLSDTTVALNNIFYHDPAKGDKVRRLLEELEKNDPTTLAWDVMLKAASKKAK